jgi:hypothetical protein
LLDGIFAVVVVVVGNLMDLKMEILNEKNTLNLFFDFSFLKI